MDNNVKPAPTAPTAAPSAPNSAGGKNNKTIIIVVIAIVVIIGGYMAFSRWRAEHAVNSMLKNLGVDTNMQQLATQGQNNDITSGDEGADLTPDQKFKAVESIEIGDAAHKAIADQIGGIVKAVYGDYKVSSFVSGYMGMNSGSCVLQYTVPKLVGVNDANSVAKEMENQGMKIVTNIQQDNAVSIMAQKDDFTYTIGFNKDEQVINAIAIKNTQQN